MVRSRMARPVRPLEPITIPQPLRVSLASGRRALLRVLRVQKLRSLEVRGVVQRKQLLRLLELALCEREDLTSVRRVGRRAAQRALGRLGGTEISSGPSFGGKGAYGQSGRAATGFRKRYGPNQGYSKSCTN